MEIIKMKVLTEDDMIKLLSKHNTRPVRPGENYLYTPEGFSHKVVFSKYHWQFCGKTLTMVNNVETPGYHLVSTIADRGKTFLWRREWLE